MVNASPTCGSLFCGGECTGRSQCRKRRLSEQLYSSAAFCVQFPSRLASRLRERYRCSGTVRQRLMLALIGEHIDAPIGATITTISTAVSFAVTIQRMSGSATTDSGGIKDSLTRRGGYAEREAHQHSGSLTWRVPAPFGPKATFGQHPSKNQLCWLLAHPVVALRGLEFLDVGW